MFVCKSEVRVGVVAILPHCLALRAATLRGARGAFRGIIRGMNACLMCILEMCTFDRMWRGGEALPLGDAVIPDYGVETQARSSFSVREN